MIDVKKRHETADGQRVIDLHYVPFNSAGGKVTYPIKGTIVRREKPIKLEYAIWSEDGEADVVWGKNSGDNLKEV